MHERVSIHQMCFAGAGLAEYVGHCQALGARQISFASPALLAEGGMAEVRATLADGDMGVESIAHVFRVGHLSPDQSDWSDSRETLSRLIDDAAALGARSVYMLTGGHGELTWEAAAECFCEAIAPCADQARAAGVQLAIENASALYGELHIAHSLADTVTLAEMAGIGVCIELFFCWAEADLPALFERTMPRCHLVQLSDYVYGDRSLPARAVPGDGAVPLERLVRGLLDAGYPGAFELELLGPRIDDEGHPVATARAAGYVSELLTRLRA